jgi:hypothetical protein
MAYIVSPDSATNSNVSWVSSAPEIVNVDSAGLLYAQKPGEAIITVNVNRDTASDSTQVVVIPPRLKPMTQTGPRPRLKSPQDSTAAPVQMKRGTMQVSIQTPASTPIALHSQIPDNVGTVTGGNENSLQIYPNPVSRTGMVQFSGLEDGYYELGFYSIQGQLLSKEFMEVRGGFNYDLQLRDPGLILVRVQGRAGTYMGKLLVN